MSMAALSVAACAAVQVDAGDVDASGSRRLKHPPAMAPAPKAPATVAALSVAACAAAQVDAGDVDASGTRSVEASAWAVMPSSVTAVMVEQTLDSEY